MTYEIKVYGRDYAELAEKAEAIESMHPEAVCIGGSHVGRLMSVTFTVPFTESVEVAA